MQHQISVSQSIEVNLNFIETTDLLTGFINTLGYKNKFVMLHFCDDTEIAEQNKRFLEKDKPTDVLSWSYIEEDNSSPCIGEIMISLPTAKKQAVSNRFTLEQELARLIAHGLAHTAGFDHIKPEDEVKMLKIETLMLANAGYEGIYKL